MSDGNLTHQTEAPVFLVIRVSHSFPVEWEKIENLRTKIKAQLADDPTFLVLPAHVDVHYMLPGDRLTGNPEVLR